MPDRRDNALVVSSKEAQSALRSLSQRVYDLDGQRWGHSDESQLCAVGE